LKFSIVVAFKNRDQKRVRLFLESLALQDEQDFELLFINQGSDDAVNVWVEPLVKEFKFAIYFYNFTQGYLWNKCNALNIGINSAKGSNIMIADIDILFPPDFIQKINKYISKASFLTHSAFYLPESFRLTNFQSFFESDYSNISNEKFIGLCIADREIFMEIRGYDEYFLQWGAEDDDIILRLEEAGKERLHLSAKITNIYHQWHPHRAPTDSNLWYVDMVNYAYLGKNSVKNSRPNFGTIYKSLDREIINRIKSGDSFKELTLVPHPIFLYTFLIDGFFKLVSGEFAQFEYIVPPKQLKGRKQKVIDKLNQLLSKANLPYTVEKKTNKFQEVTRSLWIDLVTYFVGKNREFLNDYYLLNTEEKLVLYLQKK